HVQVGATAQTFQFRPLQANLLEELKHRRGGAGIDLFLGAPVTQLGATSDSAPGHGRGGYFRIVVQLEVPHEGAAVLTSQQASGVLADNLRVQRDSPVRSVERLPPLSCFCVKRPTGSNKGWHVRDCVEDFVTVTGTFNEHPLVERRGGGGL